VRRIPSGDYVSTAGLQARGWTATLMRRFLGEPDRTVDNPHYKSAAPMRLYWLARVVEAEASPGFAAASARARRRQAAAVVAVETKRESMRRHVDALRVTVPILQRDELYRRACEHYNERQATRRDPWEYDEADPGRSDQGFLHRISVNYLRHELTMYEHELDRLYGRVGGEEAYHAIRDKVLEAIAEAYPFLVEECQRQRARQAPGVPA
jgi:hypothetical protein